MIWGNWVRGVRMEIRLAALFTMLAPMLGGAVKPWEQGIVLLLFAGLMLFTKAERRIPWYAWTLIGTLFLPVVAAFFPEMGPVPSWRKTVVQDMALPLGPWHSPQPWLTAEGAVLLLTGVMIWVWWRSRWLMPQERWFLMRMFCLGVLLVAVIALMGKATGWQIPFWESPLKFGPFPNRNQTANLLSIGAVAMLACSHHALRVRRPWSCWGWVLALLLTLLALVFNYSRAGIFLFALGAMTWLSTSVLASRKPQAKFMVAGGFLIFLLGAFLLVGGDTLKRVQLTLGEDGNVRQDFRMKLYQDAFNLWKDEPLVGVGYGNFEGVFNFYREASVSSSRALHPDSDLVWLACEGGMVSILGVVGLLVWWLWGLFPFRNEQDRTARLAAATGVGLFLFHSVFDVSGHRLGTVLPVLLLMAVAQSPKRRMHGGTGWSTPVLRVTGLFLAAVGGLWIAGTLGQWPLPGRVGVSQALALAQKSGGDSAEAYRRMEQARNWAPLELELYKWHAVLAVRTGQPLSVAEQDLRWARGLELFSPEMTVSEVRFWMAVHPPSALPALGETLARAGEDWALYLPGVIGLASQDPMTREWLRRTCSTRNEWRVVFLKYSTTEEFRAEVARLLEEDPTLSSVAAAQWDSLFEAAVDRDPDFLVSDTVMGNEKWMKQAWPHVAKVLASRGKMAEAIGLVREHAVRPTLPARPLHMDMDELAEAFSLRPHDYSLAYAVYFAQVNSERIDLALAALRQVSDQPDCPSYFFYLEFELLDHQQNWPEAWKTWQQYRARLLASGKLP
jgi:hypothetical protein